MAPERYRGRGDRRTGGPASAQRCGYFVAPGCGSANPCRSPQPAGPDSGLHSFSRTAEGSSEGLELLQRSDSQRGGHRGGHRLPGFDGRPGPEPGRASRRTDGAGWRATRVAATRRGYRSRIRTDRSGLVVRRPCWRRERHVETPGPGARRDHRVAAKSFGPSDRRHRRPEACLRSKGVTVAREPVPPPGRQGRERPGRAVTPHPGRIRKPKPPPAPPPRKRGSSATPPG